MATSAIQKQAQTAVAKQAIQSGVLMRLKTSESKEIYKMMTNGKALKEMTNDELVEAVRTISKAVTVMVGAHIESGMEIATLKMMKVFLHKHFSFLTVAEIIYSFEYNSLQPDDRHVKLFGRPLNTDFLGRVVKQYVDYRSENVQEIASAVSQISYMVEESNPKPAEVTDEDRKQMLQISYKQFVDVPRGNIYYPERMYDYAERFGLIEKNSWQKELDRAISSLRGQLTMQIANLHRDNKVGEAIEKERIRSELSTLTTGKCMEFYGEKITEQAKLHCLVRLYTKLKGDGVENIF